METVNTRDRYGNTSFNTGLGEVPEYLQYKKKQFKIVYQQNEELNKIL